MTPADWTILSLYIVVILGMSVLIGRAQKNQDDYYLGGRKIRPWQAGLSIMANQVSAISMISAPAFIAMRDGGGLVWLQYEFAVPLAMIFIIMFLVPAYHGVGGITIYEYLERRFGPAARSTLSLVFLLSRGLGAGVVLLATSIVTSVCLGLDLAPTIVIIGGVSLLYTTIGGIKADIYSDIIQLIVLWSGAILSIVIIVILLDGAVFDFFRSDARRLLIFDMRSTGLGDGRTFAFWPMLFGGLFLYLSYYGCDQSQAQRLLTLGTAREAQRALVWNGLLRFPLVLTYCAFGILLIPFLHQHPDFAARLEKNPPDFLVPLFLVEYIPKGILGIIIAGIFAASMSSIDSVLNSLSAATWKDFIERYVPRARAVSPATAVRISRLLTFLWGSAATVFALAMIGGPQTVLELVNKIGSAFYGPILAVFLLGILTRRAGETGAVTGLILGVACNVILWRFFEAEVSWMWWNVIGFVMTFGGGYIVSLLPLKSNRQTEASLQQRPSIDLRASAPRLYYIILIMGFVVMVSLSLAIQGLMARLVT